MLIRKHKAIFIHIPKTAGSSIELALKPYRDFRHILLRRTFKTFKSLGIRDTASPGIYMATHASAKDYKKKLGDEYKIIFHSPLYETLLTSWSLIIISA